MEFEKGIFRVYERILKSGPDHQKERLTRCCKDTFLLLTIFSLLNLYTYHQASVGKFDTLKNAMETQMKESFYR